MDNKMESFRLWRRNWRNYFRFYGLRFKERISNGDYFSFGGAELFRGNAAHIRVEGLGFRVIWERIARRYDDRIPFPIPNEAWVL